VVEPTLNCTELSILVEASQHFIFNGNNNSVQEYSYDSINEEEEEKVQLSVFKTGQLRLLNRFRNYRQPASYSVRSTNNVYLFIYLNTKSDPVWSRKINEEVKD